MSLPDISHLQFKVLDSIGAREVSGKELRKALREAGIRKSGPGFYQLMARMEDGKLVKGWYVEEEIDGHRRRERRYKLLGKGVKALNATIEFYRQSAVADLEGGKVHG